MLIKVTKFMIMRGSEATTAWVILNVLDNTFDVTDCLTVPNMDWYKCHIYLGKEVCKISH